MNFSRRDFLLAGSALSTLWLAGCGGGASASGEPKPTTAGAVTTSTGSCGVMTAADNQWDSSSTPAISFTNFTPAALSVAPFFLTSNGSSVVASDLVPTLDVTPYMGSSNPYGNGLPQDNTQEMFVSIVQTVNASSTALAAVRALRLHLAIPPDATNNTLLQPGYTFEVGDPTNATCAVFDGLLVVNDPAADDGSNNWAFQIVSGQVKILYFDGLASIALQLTDVVASADAAGTGNNSAVGSVTMNGKVLLAFDLIGDVIGVVT